MDPAKDFPGGPVGELVFQFGDGHFRRHSRAELHRKQVEELDESSHRDFARRPPVPGFISACSIGRLRGIRPPPVGRRRSGRRTPG